jgi:hypothetical protein
MRICGFAYAVFRQLKKHILNIYSQAYEKRKTLLCTMGDSAFDMQIDTEKAFGLLKGNIVPAE